MTSTLDKFHPDYYSDPAVEETDGDTRNIYVYPRRFVEVELDDHGHLKLSVEAARALGQQLIAAADAVESGR
jgi:hypothetical protein